MVVGSFNAPAGKGTKSYAASISREGRSSPFQSIQNLFSSSSRTKASVQCLNAQPKTIHVFSSTHRNKSSVGTRDLTQRDIKDRGFGLSKIQYGIAGYDYQLLAHPNCIGQSLGTGQYPFIPRFQVKGSASSYRCSVKRVRHQAHSCKILLRHWVVVVTLPSHFTWLQKTNKRKTQIPSSTLPGQSNRLDAYCDPRRRQFCKHLRYSTVSLTPPQRRCSIMRSSS